MRYVRARRINTALFLSRFRGRRTNLYQYGAFKRRRFLRPSGRYPVYRGSTRYVNRPLGNPLAVTERKYFDTDRDTAPIAVVTGGWGLAYMDPTGPGGFLIHSFNSMEMGTSWQERIGNKIQILSIKMNLEFGIQSGTYIPAQPEFAQLVRFILYVDKQSNGVTTAEPNLVLASGTATVLQARAFQNGNAFGRFKVLIDKTYTMQINSVYNSNSNALMVNGANKAVSLTYNFNPPLTVHYNSGNTGTNKDIIDNSIHFAIGCDNSAPSMFCNYKARLTFIDC